VIETLESIKASALAAIEAARSSADLEAVRVGCHSESVSRRTKNPSICREGSKYRDPSSPAAPQDDRRRGLVVTSRTWAHPDVTALHLHDHLLGPSADGPLLSSKKRFDSAHRPEPAEGLM